MKISYTDGMFEVDSPNICYGRFENMYHSGDGVGLQVNNESRREEIEKKCDEIYKLVVELDNLTKEEVF